MLIISNGENPQKIATNVREVDGVDTIPTIVCQCRLTSLLSDVHAVYKKVTAVITPIKKSLTNTIFYT